MEEHHLLNDADFAGWLVASRSRSRPRGKNLLIRELKSKGIAVDEIAKVLPDQEDEVALAQAALKKKLPVFLRLGGREFRAKAGRFLAARGFGWDVIERVIKKGYNDNN